MSAPSPRTSKSAELQLKKEIEKQLISEENRIFGKIFLAKTKMQMMSTKSEEMCDQIIKSLERKLVVLGKIEKKISEVRDCFKSDRRTSIIDLEKVNKEISQLETTYELVKEEIAKTN